MTRRKRIRFPKECYHCPHAVINGGTCYGSIVAKNDKLRCWRLQAGTWDWLLK